MKVKTIRWRDSTLYLEQRPVGSKWEIEIITSVGFVIEETKDIIVLAGDRMGHDVRRAVVIPKENIIN